MSNLTRPHFVKFFFPVLAGGVSPPEFGMEASAKHLPIWVYPQDPVGIRHWFAWRKRSMEHPPEMLEERFTLLGVPGFHVGVFRISFGGSWRRCSYRLDGFIIESQRSEVSILISLYYRRVYSYFPNIPEHRLAGLASNPAASPILAQHRGTTCCCKHAHLAQFIPEVGPLEAVHVCIFLGTSLLANTSLLSSIYVSLCVFVEWRVVLPPRQLGFVGGFHLSHEKGRSFQRNFERRHCQFIVVFDAAYRCSDSQYSKHAVHGINYS